MQEGYVSQRHVAVYLTALALFGTTMGVSACRERKLFNSSRLRVEYTFGDVSGVYGRRVVVLNRATGFAIGAIQVMTNNTPEEIKLRVMQLVPGANVVKFELEEVRAGKGKTGVVEVELPEELTCRKRSVVYVACYPNECPGMRVWTEGMNLRAICGETFKVSNKMEVLRLVPDNSGGYMVEKDSITTEGELQEQLQPYEGVICCAEKCMSGDKVILLGEVALSGIWKKAEIHGKQCIECARPFLPLLTASKYSYILKHDGNLERTETSGVFSKLNSARVVLYGPSRNCREDASNRLMQTEME